MDLRVYYRKIRDAEASIHEPFPVLCSLETQDGGKEGVLTEVPRHVAAKQIAEGRARLATAEETKAFHAENRRQRRQSEEMERINRLQVVVMPPKASDLTESD